MTNDLNQAIIDRNNKYPGVSNSIKKMDRFVNEIYDSIPHKPKNALYIGVGHGHDALLALLNERVHKVVGVDPYIESHGNGEEAFCGLSNLIDNYKLSERFVVFHEYIEDYLKKCDKKYDLIIASDVLHHIYSTKQLLSKSKYSNDSVVLFQKLASRSRKETRFVVCEVQRYGLIPFAKRIGFFKKSSVNYRTKQSWKEWHKAIVRGGWRLEKKAYYVPYSLRTLKPLLSNIFIGPLLCRRYILFYKLANCF